MHETWRKIFKTRAKLQLGDIKKFMTITWKKWREWRGWRGGQPELPSANRTRCRTEGHGDMDQTKGQRDVTVEDSSSVRGDADVLLGECVNVSARGTNCAASPDDQTVALCLCVFYSWVKLCLRVLWLFQQKDTKKNKINKIKINTEEEQIMFVSFRGRTVEVNSDWT